MLGAFARHDRAGAGADLQRAFDLSPILQERLHQPAGTFSGGEQQMLAIAELKSGGVTILLVEQNAHAALALADHGYVLEVGAISFGDTGQNLLADDRVRRAYLGEDRAGQDGPVRTGGRQIQEGRSAGTSGGRCRSGARRRRTARSRGW